MKGNTIRQEIQDLKAEIMKGNYRSPFQLRACRKRIRRLKQQLQAIAANNPEVAKAQLKLI